MNLSTQAFNLYDELDGILEEGLEYAENCHRVAEDGWCYPDEDNGAPG